MSEAPSAGRSLSATLRVPPLPLQRESILPEGWITAECMLRSNQVRRFCPSGGSFAGLLRMTTLFIQAAPTFYCGVNVPAETGKMSRSDKRGRPCLRLPQSLCSFATGRFVGGGKRYDIYLRVIGCVLRRNLIQYRRYEIR